MELLGIAVPDCVLIPLYKFLLCLLGIVISVVLPLIRGKLPHPRKFEGADPWWHVYVWVGIFSGITAVLVIAFAKDAVASWRWYDAVLAGYAWDSTLQKMV